MAKAEKRLVTMHDGRQVGFGTVEKVQKHVVFALDGKVPKGIRFDGANGDSVMCEFSQLPDYDWQQAADPDNVSLWAMVHGFLQKLGDEYSGRDSVADCLESVRMLWARLTRNMWDAESRGFGGSSLLLEAVLLAFPKQTRDEARKILADMKPIERKALQQDSQVKVHFDALSAAKAGAVDTAALRAKFQR